MPEAREVPLSTSSSSLIDVWPHNPAIPVPAGAGVSAPPDAKAELRRSHAGLDWFSFFLADIQTGFGPFVAVYLTSHEWTQVNVGLVLTVGGLVALAGQIPGGAVVDAVRSPRLVASLAVGAICLSALALAAWPIFPVVVGSRVLHAGASCILAPAVAAISLQLAGHAGLGERIGRNARFAAIGSAIGAGVMGAFGSLFSNGSVFLFAAALVLPALFALSYIRGECHEFPRAAGIRRGASDRDISALMLLTDRSLLLFAACVLLFHLANAGMLPLMAGVMSKGTGHWATAAVGACMVVPQLVVAACAPWVGRQAQRRGRRPLLIACFVALALRGLLFVWVANPLAVIAVQLLDGVSAAALGVLYPLIIADITGGNGRFNLALGVVGSAVGIGASLSTLLAGSIFDHVGSITFLVLAGIALAGLLLVALGMPETRPENA